MVLEEASSSADTPFTSDDGAFESPSSQVLQYNFTSLPGPLPILGPLFGFNQARIEAGIRGHIVKATTVLHRPPTQEEAQALAFHTCKDLRLASAGGPVGLVGGLYRAYSTRDTWRFPFWKQKEGFNPESVRIAGRELLTGDAAKSFYRMARTMLYASNGVMLGFMLVIPYAATVGAVGMRTDPRLKEYTEAIVKTIKEKRAKGAETGEAQGQQGGNGAYGRGVGGTGGRSGAPGPSGPVLDDASPSGGAYGDQQYSISKEAFPSDTDSAQSGTTPQTGGRSEAWNRATTRSQPQQEKPTPSGGFYDDYDNPSPTAQSPSNSTPSPSGGSAWDRIRRGASDDQKEGSGQKWPPPQQPSGEKSYSFSNADEDRQLARSEAQKAFDDRIEKERRGGDFGSGGGRGKW